MPIILYRERKPSKNGWDSRVPSLRLTAHGATPDEADENLKGIVRAFLSPFQRAGTLQQEMRVLGLGPVGDEIEFTLE